MRYSFVLYRRYLAFESVDKTMIEAMCRPFHVPTLGLRRVIVEERDRTFWGMLTLEILTVVIVGNPRQKARYLRYMPNLDSVALQSHMQMSRSKRWNGPKQSSSMGCGPSVDQLEPIRVLV
ncbi:hypothetical protein BT93_C0181 [Corymbia citriodora subsp. variegata]|nr:hypothetical protein BT93_C0181 [Corymbia citriodora subsp. variegata]